MHPFCWRFVYCFSSCYVEISRLSSHKEMSWQDPAVTALTILPDEPTVANLKAKLQYLAQLLTKTKPSKKQSKRTPQCPPCAAPKNFRFWQIEAVANYWKKNRSGPCIFLSRNIKVLCNLWGEHLTVKNTFFFFFQAQWKKERKKNQHPPEYYFLQHVKKKKKHLNLHVER